MRGALLVAVALACAAVVAFVWLRRNGPEAGPKAPATSQITPTATSAPAASPLPATPRPAARPPPELDRAALASPQTTVETELRLLEAGEQVRLCDPGINVPGQLPEIARNAPSPRRPAGQPGDEQRQFPIRHAERGVH